MAVWRAAAVLVVALAFFAVASAAVDKNATHQEMLSLAQQMKSLKPQAEANTQARTAYAAAEARYRDLSVAMGGDDPGQMGMHGAATRRAAPTKVVPTTPAGCGPSTATFTQSTPVAIPTGPAVVTSTLIVSGAGPYLFDLDLTTNITHSSAADLDITLKSPSGKVVTLATDNGADNDNVFNGTVWDDDANPAGQVPYTTNNGLVTDHAYVNLTTATPLAPEEALGAFLGENPNGTWTITISDDLAGNGGSLDSWSLAVTTFAGSPTTTVVPTVTNSTPVVVPTGPAVATSTIVVAGAGTSILDVDATTFITHTFAADLDITLMSPAGTVVTLTTDNGAGNVFNGTVWDDDANPAGQVPYTTNNGLATDHAYVNLITATPLAPEEPLAAFIGEDPNGTWTITISDDTAGDGGSLDSWSLDIDTFSCPGVTGSGVTGTMTVSGDFTPGGIVVYTVILTNNGDVTQTDNPGDEFFIEFPVGFTVVSATASCDDASQPTDATPVSATAPCGTINILDNRVSWNGEIPPATSATILPATSPRIVPVVRSTSTCGGSSLGGFVSIQGTISFDIDANGTNETSRGTDDSSTAAPNDPTIFKYASCSVDLSLTKTLTSSPPINVGDNVVFTLTVTNSGPSSSTGAVVTDTVPAGLTYVSNDCGASFASPTLTWNVAALAVSASAICHLTMVVTQPGMIVNSATATGNESDPEPSNNTGTATVIGLPPSRVEIPTLGSVGLALLFLALAAAALLLLRRRRPA